VISPLHCSEAFCDLHDYQINTSGICLRQDALRRSRNAPRSGSHDEGLAGAIWRLGEILERMEERQPNWSPPPPAPQQPRTTQRKGGTPL
jgi:hypothetical protein